LAVGLLAALGFAGYALDLKQAADAAKTAALEQEQRASEALAAATQTANEMVYDMAGKFRGRTGMPVDLTVEILSSAQNLQRRLAESGATTPDLRYGQAVALNELADAYAEQGKDDEGVKAGEQARDILVDLLRVQPTNTGWKQTLADSHHRIGRAYRGNLCEGGLTADRAERALTAYRAGLAMREELRGVDPGAPEWQNLIVESHSAIGDTMLEANNRERALESYRAGLAVAKRLAADHPDDQQWQARLAVSSMEVAVVLPYRQRAERLEILRMSVKDLQNAADAMPDIRQRRRDLSYGYAYLCTDLVETKDYEAALDAAQHGVEIVQGLLKVDPDNADWHRVSRFVYEHAREVFVAIGRDDKVQQIDDEVEALNKRRAAAGNDCGRK
jgi:tetratricopeptide (TPR) repeat protein